MHTINADLHCHSVVSDGTLTPEALAARAKNNGVQLWALTDHDELGGQKRAKQAATELGMQYVSGVEISVTWSGQTVHIVGLGVDDENKLLIDGLYRTRNGRSERAKEMSAQLEKVGIPNAYEGALHFVGNPELVSRTHFARYLVEAGVCKDTDEVFANYLIEGKPGFVAHSWATLDNAVQWITGAGGVAVIAHPGRYRYTSLQLTQLYEQFKDLGGKGIEVVTGSHSATEFKTFAKVAQQYDFLASRGSDFHDPQESHTDLGQLPNLPTQLRPVWSVFQ
ncbi:PHP domain-containing protein [Polynucleobacter sp. MWH-Spelu-300-X4]|mgnify:CR=1 FL=1|jgi:predicted metal-dependent phosphoesterase TrpH|uniref:3',5'-nucleoside bisphosphate phosphatase n=1 Tax=Polynucleobacter sp. MWH-Spelu-300-X4 TaxID=2689109 RepID=UPI001BFEBB2B|nr:3',5'-nucleoside bisphosphate phosphatase [Polynucleobacter sp. MWH-Spelu-300-X4]QWD79147.1 PHP domain-containing protein [Polynucleobacter sp. MWH-Spelu-300-X4]